MKKEFVEIVITVYGMDNKTIAASPMAYIEDDNDFGRHYL